MVLALGYPACHIPAILPLQSQILTSADTIDMSVLCPDGGSWRTLLTQPFKPFDNLRLMAPNSLRVTHGDVGQCNITWSVPQSSHYIEKYLEFHVRLRTLDQSWEEIRPWSIKQNQQWISLENLAADTSYELQVQVQSQKGSHNSWSPWSQPLPFRTKPAVLTVKAAPEFSQLNHVLVALGGAVSFLILVTLLFNCRSIGPRLKKVLKCHIPDPSEFFAQLSSEHGDDFQKWLASPFPSSSFSPSGLATEISPLEVLDRDTKAAQLLMLQQEKPGPSSPSSHSLTSCFTNQGYFFFHLPDALEIESCQVYFTYDPCTEELEEGEPRVPEGGFPPVLPPPPGEENAYCIFPPGDELLSPPSLLSGPGPTHLVSQPQGPPTLGASSQVHTQSPGEGGEEAPAPSTGSCFPWASPPGGCQIRPPHSCLALNTDAYLSLQELQDQDPAHSM